MSTSSASTGDTAYFACLDNWRKQVLLVPSGTRVVFQEDVLQPSERISEWIPSSNVQRLPSVSLHDLAAEPFEKDFVPLPGGWVTLE